MTPRDDTPTDTIPPVCQCGKRRIGAVGGTCRTCGRVIGSVDLPPARR